MDHYILPSDRINRLKKKRKDNCIDLEKNKAKIAKHKKIVTFHITEISKLKDKLAENEALNSKLKNEIDDILKQYGKN